MQKIKTQGTSGSGLETGGCERQGGGFSVCVGGGAETSRQYTENHYGDSNQGAQGSEAWSERKA